MIIRLKAFSRCVEILGASELEWELPEGSTTSELMKSLVLRFPALKGLPVAVAVNHEVAGPGTVIGPKDEVAILPPVSGG